MNLVKPFYNKTFDVNKMQEDNIVSMDFTNNQNAINFKSCLEREMGYQVELVYIKELQEILETDENNF